MVSKSSDNRSPNRPALPVLITTYFLRLLQLITSLALLVIFGTDVQNAHKAHVPIHTDWLYSLAVSSISLIFCLTFSVPRIVDICHRLFFLDALVSLFYLVTFGIWGRNYFPRQCAAEDTDCRQLKIAAWFALAGWLLWLITSGVGLWSFHRERTQVRGGSWADTLRGRRAKSGYPHSNV